MEYASTRKDLPIGLARRFLKILHLKTIDTVLTKILYLDASKIFNLKMPVLFGSFSTDVAHNGCESTSPWTRTRNNGSCSACVVQILGLASSQYFMASGQMYPDVVDEVSLQKFTGFSLRFFKFHTCRRRS